MTLARIKSIDKDTGHTGSLLVKSHQASPASGYPPAWNAGQREYYYHRKSCKRELMQQISRWWNVHSISMSAAAFRNNRFEFTIGSRIWQKNKTQYPSVELWIHFFPRLILWRQFTLFFKFSSSFAWWVELEDCLAVNSFRLRIRQLNYCQYYCHHYCLSKSCR